MTRTGRSATTAAESSGEALSTTVTLTQGSRTSGSTQKRRVSRLLYATITASTVTWLAPVRACSCAAILS
jgi:hypothetical protein